jgi:hypothetical protein
MHYISRYWYSLMYSNAYLFINVVVIVFILCSDPDHLCGLVVRVSAC